MDVNRINKLRQLAFQKMDDGDFLSALNLANEINSLGSHYLVSYIVSALFIDIGSAMGDEEIINEGVELLQKDYNKIVLKKKYAQTANYNLANGFYSLFKFKKMKDRCAAYFNESELDKAKVYYRKALECNMQNPKIASQIFVNFGNCLNNSGRVIEALESYEEALKWKPDHSMALANKGVALCYYVGLIGEHQSTFLIEAYSLLSQALKLGVLPESVSYFKKYLNDIRKWFPDKKKLDTPPSYPGYKIETTNEFKRFLIGFCLENKLYLNPCNYCQKCNAAIGDPMVIQKMIIEKQKSKEKNFIINDPYLRLSSFLNQIKQDYVSARFLLILSQYKGLNLDFVDKNVRIIDTLDYTMHNIYVQLLKAAFRNFYNILDKIAYFIKDYLKLKIKGRIYFHRIWYSNMQEKTIHCKIKNIQNYSLNALFDIHRDFNGPYKKLLKTRNALTHRFVNIRMIQESEDEENMTQSTLLKQTLELAKIVRNCIIYLLYFVYIEERKKEKKTKGITVPLFALELPDDLKSSR